MRPIKILTLALLLAAAALAQAPQHSVTLTWIDTVNPTGTVYNVYRLASACPATPPNIEPDGFTRIASSLAVFTYKDTAVTSGTTYCYFLTAGVVGGTGATSESAASGDVGGTIPGTFPPQMLSVTVTQ